MLGASIALGVSDIPWSGPVSAVRMGGQQDADSFISNPDYEFRHGDDCQSDLVVCGRQGKVTMLEAGASEVSEERLEAGIAAGLEEIERLEEWQSKIIAQAGRAKREVKPAPVPEAVKELFAQKLAAELEAAVFSGRPGKDSINALHTKWREVLAEHGSELDTSLAERYLEEEIDRLIHHKAVRENKRPDGRSPEEVRPIYAQAGGISPIHHGCGVFYRGGTHILSVLTLGGPDDSQIIEEMEVREKRRFMHHYNFPPFSVGETGRIGGANRRMIGHGALAEKALWPVIPTKEEFPYTIRLVSEALASNGSTSMASVCGSTLALMDGGVPVKKPVAGIASGLMLEDEEHYTVLTDIQGPEDHYGDMDFKVAGTRDGVTAVQMDVKGRGVSRAILSEAFVAARRARLHILDEMAQAIAEPRPSLSPNAPFIASISIDPQKIGGVIGPGGKTITEIREKTGTEIEIEDDGTVFIIGKEEGVKEAEAEIEMLTREYEIGQQYQGTVASIVDFGAFVKLDPRTDGLLHISEIAPFRVGEVKDLLSVGQEVPVVIKEKDDRGRLKLSLKAADPQFFQPPPAN